MQEIRKPILAETAFVTILLLGAAFVRMRNLGAFSFWNDELFHVLAAQSYVDHGDLFIPLVGNYTRALPVTWITIFITKYMGLSEFSARLPFVLINLFFLIISYIAVRKLVNRGTALLFLIVMAFSPFEVSIARECRMYGMLQLLYFFAVYFFCFGFEWRGHQDQTGELKQNFELRFQKNIKQLALAGILFLLSMRIHKLSVNFLCVVLGYCVIFFIWDAFRENLISVLRSKYFIVICCAIATFLTIYFAFPHVLNSYLYLARKIPSFSNRTLSDTGYYRYFLSDNYPFFFFIYPLSAFMMVKEKGRRGVFLLLAFSLPFLLHTYILGRKLIRYIYYIFPFFIVCSSFFTARLASFSWRQLREHMKDITRYAWPVMLLTVFFAFNTVGYPWLANIRKIGQVTKYPDYKTLPSDLVQKMNEGIILTTRYKQYYYYGGKLPQYYIRRFDEDYTYKQNDRYPIKVLKTMSDIRRVFKENDKSLFVLMDEWTWRNKSFLSREMVSYIKKHTRKIQHSGDGRILIFQKSPA